MKWIFAILLVINASFFAFMQLDSNQIVDPLQGHEPVRADKLKLLEEPSAQLPEPGVDASSDQVASVDLKPEICLEWGQFTGDTLLRVTKILEDLQLGEKVSQYKAEKSGGFWVYVPPRISQQDAQRKVEELKRLGVMESYIVRESSAMQFAISLGIFSTPEAASKYLDQLRARGVKSAITGPRTQEIDATIFQVKDSGEAMTAELTKLKLDFPGSELKAVECRKAVAKQEITN